MGTMHPAQPRQDTVETADEQGKRALSPDGQPEGAPTVLQSEVPVAGQAQAQPAAAEQGQLDPQPEPWDPTQPPDPIGAQAIDQARQALLAEVDPGKVGDHLEVVADGPRVVSHHFVCTDFAYQGWYWSVTLARTPQGQRPTVSEVVLLPGEQALRAPEWLPWSQRLRPGDVGVGDLLPTPEDDYRLVPGYFPVDDSGSEAVEEDERADLSPQAAQWALEQEVPLRTGWQLGLGKARVLSPLGRIEVAQRWYEGPGGPNAAIAEVAPAQCSTCGFFVPLAGGLMQMFGACANEFAPDEGRVVSVDHGCGAHSEVAVVPKSHSADLVVDQFAFDEFALQPEPGQPEQDQPDQDQTEQDQPEPGQPEQDQPVEGEAVESAEASLRSRHTQ